MARTRPFNCRLPADHPVFSLPLGFRSKFAQDALDLYWKLDQLTYGPALALKLLSGQTNIEFLLPVANPEVSETLVEVASDNETQAILANSLGDFFNL